MEHGARQNTTRVIAVGFISLGGTVANSRW